MFVKEQAGLFALMLRIMPSHLSLITDSMKTQGKLLIGLGWSEGTHFIKNGSQRKTQTFVKEERIYQQIFTFMIKNFGVGEFRKLRF